MVLFYTNSHFQYISVPFEHIFNSFLQSCSVPGVGLESFLASEFLPQGPGFCSLFCPEGGDFTPSNKFPRGWPGGERC